MKIIWSLFGSNTPRNNDLPEQLKYIYLLSPFRRTLLNAKTASMEDWRDSKQQGSPCISFPPAREFLMNEVKNVDVQIELFMR